MAGMKADRSFQSITMATEASSEAIAYTACDTVAPHAHVTLVVSGTD
jgi:hypothetical protein